MFVRVFFVTMVVGYFIIADKKHAQEVGVPCF